ncbi:MAG: transposase family protein [Wolbachia sp.]|nr:transposase family protein [Wolbachia sp.]MDD9336148.1 transposase family protein [Wolbachia sp.]
MHILPNMKVLADAVYREIQKIHTDVELPHRKTKKKSLTKEQKQENQELTSQRVVVENVIGLLKKFKIIAGRYQSR